MDRIASASGADGYEASNATWAEAVEKKSRTI